MITAGKIQGVINNDQVCGSSHLDLVLRTILDCSYYYCSSFQMRKLRSREVKQKPKSPAPLSGRARTHTEVPLPSKPQLSWRSPRHHYLAPPKAWHLPSRLTTLCSRSLHPGSQASVQVIYVWVSTRSAQVDASGWQALGPRVLKSVHLNQLTCQSPDCPVKRQLLFREEKRII